MDQVSDPEQDYLLAHGIGGDASDASIGEFVRLGFEHMVLGWDHLLFVVGMLLICRNWWLAAKLISVFVLGHSSTLILAGAMGWGLNPTLVDLVIAMSVLVVGAFGISGRAVDVTKFGAVVLVFGLIHGLGLAARLEDIGIGEDGKLVRVVAFNLGVELGQLAAVFGFATVGYVAVKVLARTDRARVVASAGVLIGGVAALIAVLLQALNPPIGQPTELALPERSTCSLAERTRELFSAGGEHPQQLFTEPSDPAPMADFGHTMEDGFVIVFYPRSANSQDVDTLRTYVNSDKGEFVLAGPNPEESEVFEVHTFYETLSCAELEMGNLVDFRNAWIESVEANS
ncbi:MAG: HupE/UreJ family protein [Nocardioides sp.]